MAVSRLFPADYVFHTLDGQSVAAAGVIYFYDNNSTNLATIYTNAAGSITSSNPLTLGSDGRLPNSVFTSATLRVKLLDSLGAQIFQKDDVVSSADIVTSATLSASSGSSLIGFIHSATGAVATTQQARDRYVVYPQDFGATGDGSADDTAEWQAAIDGCDNKVIDGLGLTYKISSTLTLVSDTHIKNAKFSFTTATDGDCLMEAFGSTGTQYTPSAAPVKGDTTINILTSVSGLSVGDNVYLRSTDNFSALDSGKRGEWLRITDISTLTVTFEQRIRHTYTAGYILYKPTLISNITLENVNMTGNGFTGSAAQYGLRAYLCKNVNVIRCVADSFGTAAFSLETVLGGNVTDCTVTRANYSLGNAYGVAITGGCDGVTVKGGRYSYLRHGVTFGGTYFTDYGITITGVTTFACSDSGIDGHPNAMNVAITGCTLDCDSTDVTQTGDGLTVQSAGVSIVGNVVRGWLRIGILAQPLTSAIEADDVWIISSNIVSAPRAASTGSAITFSNESGKAIRGVVIANNVIQAGLATSGSAISIYNTTSPYGAIRTITINGNSIYCRSQCILITAANLYLIDDVSIVGNSMTTLSSAVPAISLVSNADVSKYLTCVSVTGNAVRGGNYSILLTDAPSRVVRAANLLQGWTTGATSGSFSSTDGTDYTT